MRFSPKFITRSSPLFAFFEFFLRPLFALLYLVFHPLTHLIFDRLSAGRNTGEAHDSGREQNQDFSSHFPPS
jgi:hypothetical protein